MPCDIMKVTRDAYLIFGATLLMVFTLLMVDVYKVINLPFLGAVHWIPEFVGIFLLSNYIAKNFFSKTKWSIFCCVVAYPVLFFQSTFGLLTATVFGTAILIGFLSVDIKKLKEPKQK